MLPSHNFCYNDTHSVCGKEIAHSLRKNIIQKIWAIDNNNEKEYTPTPDEMAENNQQEATATHNTAPQADNDPVVQLQQELGEQKEKYIRLYSEFDNFRRRTAKETSQDIEALREGLQLVFQPPLFAKPMFTAIKLSKSTELVKNNLNRY